MAQAASQETKLNSLTSMASLLPGCFVTLCAPPAGLLRRSWLDPTCPKWLRKHRLSRRFEFPTKCNVRPCTGKKLEEAQKQCAVLKKEKSEAGLVPGICWRERGSVLGAQEEAEEIAEDKEARDNQENAYEPGTWWTYKP